MTPGRPPTLTFILVTSVLAACSTARPSEPLSFLEELPPQTAVYYNARIALRQGRHKDVLKLWLLRNALTSQGEAPIHDSDFRSAVWASVSGAGLCHDGLRTDDDPGGAGLWPLALHNWLTRSSSKQQAPEQPRTFTSFGAGFQQRRFSLHDVLSAEELGGTRFVRGDCLRPYLTLVQLDTRHWLNLRDRLSTGIMMRDLIVLAQHSLDSERVRGLVVLETRLFDLEVALAKLARSKARQETGLIAQLARTTGVSESAMTLLRDKRLAAVRESQYTELLRRCLTWPVEDWLSLSPDRRLALFGESRDAYANDDDTAPDRDRTLLSIIDALVQRQDGKALTQWLGYASPGEDPGGESALLTSITGGARGERLLSLGPESGFRERSAIALRRGTASLTLGSPLDAMRSFALSMKHSDESRRSGEVHNLAKRWFAYVLSQHQASEEVLAILSAFVSPVDRNQLLEVLLWRAAFHADPESFERIAARIRRGGALDLRVHQLRLLSRGDAGAMWRQTRAQAEHPSSVYRFVTLVTEELATEPLDVRRKNIATLELGTTLLSEVAAQTNPGLRRRIVEQQQRIQTLLDGLDKYAASPSGKAYSVAPGSEAYAGSVRLAPADPMPWPFAVPRVQAPSPFSPIQLTPVEWNNDDGEQVFGWHIHDKWRDP